MQLIVDPADLTTLQRLLTAHGVRPKKRLGQNFLVDPGYADRVVSAAGVRPRDAVLEVGAGPGTLSVRFAAIAGRLTCVELDRRLVHVLREVLAGHDNVAIVEGDVLKLSLPPVAIVAGNIPYYLTGALIPLLLDKPEPPRRLSLVVQREVAERWTTSGDWSLATLSVSALAEAELRFVIPAGAFWPRPQVDSALVTLEVRDQPAINVADLSLFFRFAERLFQFRRKQLSASLARLGHAGAGERLAALDIEPTRRPQTLSLSEWARVYREFGASP
jgi:16S rRNA (adenine1518-N6/adenine1519-N6)-dimethyltransferase